MKLTIGILVLGMAVGTAWGQTDAIDNTRSTMKALQQKQAMDENAALDGPQAQPANPAPTAAKPATQAAQQKGTPSSVTIVRKPVVAASTTHAAVAPKVAVKPAVAITASKKAAIKPTVAVTVAPKVVAKAAAPKVVAKTSAGKTPAKATSKAAKVQPVVAVEDKKNPVDAKKEEPNKKINLTGRRDPFISPVVNRSMVGSGCSTGKRCLAIDQIALRGVVKSDTGMIAVVTNALDKAYFLHENDPVFNGYVVKITGDSIVFKESVQDKMGKPFMREVTKTISTPAV